MTGAIIKLAHQAEIVAMTICRLLVVLVVSSATAASAQSAYITAAAGREFSRLSNVEVTYLGGVAFNRTTEHIRYESTRRVAGLVVPFSARSEIYGLAPIGGVDARIALTDHIRLVPGMRFQGIGAAASSPGGWLIRPSAGLMLAF